MDTGGGGFVPGAGRLVSKTLLAQGMPAQNTPSALSSAYSLTLSAPSGSTALTLQNGARLYYTGASGGYLSGNGTDLLLTSASFLPASNSSRDLGATATGWRDLYLARLLIMSGTAANTIQTNTTALSAGASAAALTVKTSAALDANDLIFDVQQNDGTTRFKVDWEGDVIAAGGLQASTLTGSTVSATSIGTAPAFRIDSTTDLTLITCNSAREGQLRRDVLSGGGTAIRTRMCVCTYDGSGATAADYDWVNITAGGTVGTETTCP